MGRHTDYAGGHSLVCAIDRGFLFASAPNSIGRLRMMEESAEFEPVEFAMSGSLRPTIGSWANYPMTMTRRIVRNFGRDIRLRGVDIAFSSTLPVGSGMSGSSALMMMTFASLAAVNCLHESRAFTQNIHDSIELAVYLACAENGQSFNGLAGDRGVGTFGGSEDHAAILTSRPGMLSLFSFCPASLQEELRWPREWRMVVAFSGARAEKTREALDKYNMASRRAAAAVRRYNQTYGTDCATLRDIVDHGGAGAAASWIDRLDVSGAEAPDLAGRVRQFIGDDRKAIPAALRALRTRDLRGFGREISSSHRASKRRLWNIVPQIDSLHHMALELGAAGASGFGAGFGGSIFAVVRAGEARDFMNKWRSAYMKRWPKDAVDSQFFIARPSSGIQLWDEGKKSRLVDRMLPG